MLSDTVPCPMCCNSQTPGQLDQPRQGWQRGELPEHVMSVPCPLCAGVGTFLKEEWDRMASSQPSPKKKKQDDSEKIGSPIWDGMKSAREQREKDWYEKGPFKISDFRKAE